VHLKDGSSMAYQREWQRMTAKPGLKRSEFPTPKREKREGISADNLANDSIKFRSNGLVAESTYSMVVPGNSSSSLQNVMY